MSIITTPLSKTLQRGQQASLLPAAPALPRNAAYSSPRPAWPPKEGDPLPTLEHLDSDPHFVRNFVMLLAGIVLTIFIFLSLPYTQKISERAMNRMFIVNVDRSRPPPPPPVESPRKEEPKREEEKKPELKQEAPKLNLSQLEAAINPGHGGSGFADFSMNLGALASEDLSRVFDLAELDRVPVAVYQQTPRYPYSLQSQHVAGSVRLQFIVTSTGAIRDIRVVSSTDREFERPSIEALERWRFEPGIKNGTKVNTRMEQPFTFVAGD